MRVEVKRLECSLHKEVAVAQDEGKHKRNMSNQNQSSHVRTDPLLVKSQTSNYARNHSGANSQTELSRKKSWV